MKGGRGLGSIRFCVLRDWEQLSLTVKGRSDEGPRRWFLQAGVTEEKRGRTETDFWSPAGGEMCNKRNKMEDTKKTTGVEENISIALVGSMKNGDH